MSAHKHHIGPSLSGCDVTAPSTFSTSTPTALLPKLFQRGAKQTFSEPDWGKKKETLKSTGVKPVLFFVENYKWTLASAVYKKNPQLCLTCENQTNEWLCGLSDIVLTSPVHWSHTNSDLYIGVTEAVVIHGATWPAANEWTDTSQTSCTLSVLHAFKSRLISPEYTWTHPLIFPPLHCVSINKQAADFCSLLQYSYLNPTPSSS